MDAPPAPVGLRPARVERGWSQTDVARQVTTLGRARGVPVASAASLKSLLSRWENGHALPDPQYRALLAELYGRTPSQLGIEGPAEEAAATGTARFRASIAAAATAARSGPGLWSDQLAAARRLDDELGATGAGELVRALVERLDETLVHTSVAADRSAFAAVLADAAVLAGSHALDAGRHDDAWRRYDRARSAGREAGSPRAVADALAGQAAVLVDAGEVPAAVILLDQADPGPSDGARVRLDAARGLAHAAAGEATAALAALAAAERRLRDTPTPRVDIVGPGGRPVVELADLDRWHGQALVELGAPGAAGPLRRALDAGPRSARHRAALHADLALALRSDHPDESAEHAHTARTVARAIGSERIGVRLAGLGRPG